MADTRAATGIATVKNELIETLLRQLEQVRIKLPEGLPYSPNPHDDNDRIFASQLAARLLEYSLRPLSIHDQAVVSEMIRPYQDGRFLTGLDVNEIVRMVAETGALHRGHFVLLSGNHSDYFFMFSKLAVRIPYRQRIAAEIASRFKDLRVQVVIGPITAGGLLVQEVAKKLDADVAFYGLDEQGRPSHVRPGYQVTDRRVLIINDLTTTGLGLKRMYEGVSSLSGRVVGLGLFGVRGEQGAIILRKFAQTWSLRGSALIFLNLPSSAAAECRQCSLDIPIVRSRDINL